MTLIVTVLSMYVLRCVLQLVLVDHATENFNVSSENVSIFSCRDVWQITEKAGGPHSSSQGMSITYNQAYRYSHCYLFYLFVG